uniref:EXS domain-containing protein n=1 Tax=Romanomermis culicivorax TaxID=13658 RepID=A0A915J2Z4_ROMCU
MNISASVIRNIISDKHWYYYAAMAADGILRLAWILNVSLGDATILEADRLLLITSILECVRRFIWNFFRLENEHATNCGKFRATLDINIKSMPAKRSPSPQAKKQDAQGGATTAVVKQEVEKAAPASPLPPPPTSSDAGLFHASLKPPAVIGFPPMINRRKKYASLIPPKIQFNPPITSTWSDYGTTRSFKLLKSVKEEVDDKEKQPTNDKTATNSPKS